MDEIRSAKASALNGTDGNISSIVIQPKGGDAQEGEADHVLVFFGLAPKLGPDRKVHVQYTTTSPIMHEGLGLEDQEN